MWMKLAIGFSIGLFLIQLSRCQAHEPSKEQPFVTCVLSGQLGNQLFEIATTLAFAWDNDMEPIFPDLNSTDLNIPVNRERIFYRLNASPLPRSILSTFSQLKTYEKIDIPIVDDQSLTGYFQTWEYFDHHRDKIIAIFAPHSEELDHLKEKHEELLKHPCTVGVHVRTYDTTWSTITPFVGLSYYEEAMSYFPDDAIFAVFSDRINWCRHHFAQFNKQIVFIEDQDHIEDLLLMSMLKHNIICNSTFSWWAAYFNQNPDKIVITPHCFVHPRHISKISANMPGWIELETDYNYVNAPYPTDIRDYDSCSKSIDTQ